MTMTCLACGGCGGETEYFSGPAVSVWVPCDWCHGSGVWDSYGDIAEYFDEEEVNHTWTS